MDLRRLTSSPVRRLLTALAAVVVAAGTLAAPGRTEAATTLYPDLRMAKVSEFHIVRTSEGRRLLRFTATMLNLGKGPFEVRANRASTSAAWNVDQAMRTDAGTTVRRDTTATMQYGGDGHGHWHVTRMVDTDLWSSGANAHGAKIGFCFFDTTAWDLSLAGAPRSPVYRESTCADLDSLHASMGISVGWGDRYAWTLPFQWVDITGLPAGNYTIRSMVDAANLFAETSNTNNCSYVRIHFEASGSGVSVLGSGSSCPDDWRHTSFANDITWATEAGIASFCGVDLFCPPAKVTRGQTATFLARALALPSTTTDFFTDDETSPNEADINRIAAAGLTTGCGSGRYCPNALVNRGELMSLLVRGFQLPPTTQDFFTDDAGSQHQANINRAAAAGIATGCGPAQFCPFGAVTRGQMVAFLHRAVDD
jgi:Lysyl oxidase/S-layer homology domain